MLVLISSMSFVSAADVGDESIENNDYVLGNGVEEENIFNYHEYVNWTIEVCNYGPDNATDVYVKDVLPEGLVYNSSSSSKGSFNNTTGIWTIGNLTVGERATLYIVCFINKTGFITNEANITSNIQDDNLQNNNDEETIFIEPSADISVSKSVNNPNPKYGDIIEYAITVTNNGPYPEIDHVRILDTLDEGLYFYTADEMGQTVAYLDFYNLDIGVPVTIYRNVYVNRTGHFNNVAEIYENEIYDWNVSNNIASVSIDVNKTADLEINKSVSYYYSEKYIPQFLFTVKLKNNGPDNAENIKVQEIMDQGLKVFSYVPSAGYVDESNNIWVLDNLENGEEESLLVDSIPLKSGFLKNEVLVSATTLDQNEENNKDSQVVYINEKSLDDENSTVKNNTSKNKIATSDSIKMYSTGNPLGVLVIVLLCSIFSSSIKRKN